jgi:hypothetical protein
MSGTVAEVLERVREYRRAARLAVESHDHPFQARCLALIDLAEAARAEPDLTVRTWSERAIWEESKRFLGMDDELPEPVPEPFERAQRKLRAQGLTSCPTCLSTLATDLDFELWRNRREDYLRTLRRREGAVG